MPMLTQSQPIATMPTGAPTKATGHALFNNILSSAQQPLQHQQQPQVTPSLLQPPMQGYTMQSQVEAAMPQYAPQQAPVQQKLNALFGVAPQPPQVYPVTPLYPVAPETAGGNFQSLMAKLSR
jgi:hypothetical protein